jgi:hypothetical protein
MKFRIGRTFIVGICGFVAMASLAGAIPLTINYQGRISDLAGEFSGDGDFMFAFVSTGSIVWNNDGSAPADPTLPVTLDVKNGIFHVILGDSSIPNMAAISPDIFGLGALELRVWFDNDGPGGALPELLVPDQPFSSTPYAVRANQVENIAVTPENTMIGYLAGRTFSGGTENTFVGALTGIAASGSGNTFLGAEAGREHTAGDENVFLGAVSGRYNSGNQNTIVGFGAGYNSSGDGNVFLGRYAGLNETGSNRLYIDNSATSFPLLYGYFVDNSEYLTINGLLNVNDNNFRIIDNSGSATTPAYYAYQGITGSTLKDYSFAIHDALWVSSNAWIDGALYSFKGTYELADYAGKNSVVKARDIDIDKLVELQPEYFMWNEPEAHEEGNLPETRQIGLNPERVQESFPELVRTDSRGDLFVNYSKLSIILLEALKEQNERLETIESRLQTIEQTIARE